MSFYEGQKYEIHVLDAVRNVWHPEGPLWKPKLDHRGKPIQFWTRREAEIVCIHIASFMTARPTRIVPVKL